MRRLQSEGRNVVGVDVVSSEADLSIELDLARPDAPATLDELTDGLPLVGLVNCAAVSGVQQGELIERWNSTLDINLRAPYLISEILIGRLATTAGSVVHVSSVHAFATSVGTAPYAAAKAGLIALARSQTVDWASRGLDVRANVVVPGAIDTPMLADGLMRGGLDLATLGSRHPAGRVGQPEEVAAAIAFLLSSEASFIRGSCLVVDGGALSLLGTEVGTAGSFSSEPTADGGDRSGGT